MGTHDVPAHSSHINRRTIIVIVVHTVGDRPIRCLAQIELFGLVVHFLIKAFQCRSFPFANNEFLHHSKLLIVIGLLEDRLYRWNNY